MEKLFTEYKVGSLTLKNRIIRASLLESLLHNNSFTSEGRITDRYVNNHINAIKGGTSMVTTGLINVKDRFMLMKWITMDFSLNHNSLKDFVDEIHRHDGMACAQLGYMNFSKPVIGMTEEELNELIDHYVKVSLVCKEKIGFDAIEIHYHATSSFVIKRYNHRSDKFGGTIENRTRWTCRLIARFRKALGEEYPIFVKFSVDKNVMTIWGEIKNILRRTLCPCCKYEPKAMPLGDLKYCAKSFERSGASAIISFRTSGDGKTFGTLKEAIVMKNEVEIPIIYNGDVRTDDDVRKVLEEGFDLIQVGRKLRKNPNFVKDILKKEKKDN